MTESGTLCDTSTTASASEMEIRRLEKVVRVLMDRAERSTRSQGSDFDLFQMTVMLEEQIGERTAQLQMALAENEKVTRALLLATEQLRASENELRRHRDHLSELVTEQTADLLAAKEAAETAHALQREFLLNMSHELRTPLHAISSYAQIGLEKAGKANPEKIADYFLRIQQSGQRLGALVEELLDISELNAGKLHLQRRRCSLQDLIDAVEHEQMALAEARGVHIAHAFACRDATAEIDPEILGKALRNLYANAIKYSPSGGCIQISLHDGCLAPPLMGDAAQALILTICDEGPGIPPGEEERIFEKFVQSTATKTGAGGAGLGLAIVSEIVRLHGGRVCVRNRAGGGAEFELSLPRHAVN